MTVLFVDIRDFTRFAERAEAREIVAYVNEFFELVVPTLTRHGGHANKFVGDGVLGVFGAPGRASRPRRSRAGGRLGARRRGRGALRRATADRRRHQLGRR